jgi:hypothetical protein
LKNLFVIAILTGVLFQSFSRLTVYVGFELNRDHIAKFLCVQKDVENNHCKGSCHLKKKLAEAEEQQQQVPHNQKEISIILYCAALAEHGWNDLIHDSDRALFPRWRHATYASPFLVGALQPPERA